VNNHMDDSPLKIKTSDYYSFAGEDIRKWSRLAGCELEHVFHGFGKVIGTIEYSDKPISLTLSFSNNRRRGLSALSIIDLKSDIESNFRIPSGNPLINTYLSNQLWILFDSRKYGEAESFFQENNHFLSETEITRFHEAKHKCREEFEYQIKKREFLEKIQELLKRHNFDFADEQADENMTIITRDEYSRLKAKFLIPYFKETLKLDLNDEQSLVLAKSAQNILIKARAGSGKTRVLASKTALLMDRYSVNPDQIIILAFNRKAATEIGHRIRKEFGFETYENARTFHSLAYQMVQPKEKLLFDDGKRDFSRPALSMFVQGVLRSIWNPAFQAKIYQLFRREASSILQTGALLDDADYLSFVKNQREITLGGDRVKSRGEKYIADFLFEHNIAYTYERVEFWSGHNYRPDFILLNYDIVIEFWGIDENDSQRRIPSWWDINWEQYRERMNEKRKYWEEKVFPLVELSIADLKS
jgi:hypothetical protein